MGALEVGERLSLTTGPATVTALRVEVLAEPVKVYNFQVADWHTYYAAPEADKPFVWVHNANGYGAGQAKTLDVKGNWHDSSGRFTSRPPTSGPITASRMRQIHIIHGDVPVPGGGGHAARAKIPGKSKYPASMTDAEIIQGIEKVANDPASYAGGVMPVPRKRGSRFSAHGPVGGIPSKVVVEPAGEGIITGHRQ